MIIDSSALVAVLLEEEDSERMIAAMVEARALRMSAANWLETAIKIDGADDAVLAEEFEALLAELSIQIVPVTVELAAGARQAYRRFGKRRHAAKLNFGDCFAYALAASRHEPLLFKGNDFSQTDIEPALR